MRDHTIRGRGVTVVVDGETLELKHGEQLPNSLPADVRDAIIDAETRDLDPGELADTGDQGQPELDLADLADEALAEKVADSKVEELLDAVGDDSELAARVLEAEKAGKDRTTLVAKLGELADTGDQGE